MPYKNRNTGWELQDGNVVTVTRSAYTISATQEDTSLVAAVPGRRIRVLALALVSGASVGVATCDNRANHVVFRSIGSATSALTGSIDLSSSGPLTASYVLPYCPVGWFQTAVGDALYVSSLQSASAVIDSEIVYAEV